MPDHNAKSPKLLALCLEALDTGIGYTAVARQFGVHKETLRRHFPGKAQASKFTEADYANWDAALSEGYGYQHVAEMYGVSKQTVAKRFPGRGWTPEQVRLHGALMSRASKMAIV